MLVHCLQNIIQVLVENWQGCIQTNGCEKRILFMTIWLLYCCSRVQKIYHTNAVANIAANMPHKIMQNVCYL